MPKSSSKGFTIVEILITVTVIAILVSITVIVYSDAKIRAHNAQTALAVRQYKDALVLYMQKNGAYPEPTTAGTKPCLGHSYTGGQCWFGNGVVDTTLMSTLDSTVGGYLPMPAMPNFALKGIMYSAPSIGNRVDGATYAAATPVAMLSYAIEGTTTKCPVGQVASKPVNGNAYWYSSLPPTSGQTTAAGSGFPIQCVVILPYE